MLANSVGGGFASEMATVLTSGRQMMQTTAYTINQMCPQYGVNNGPGPVEVGDGTKQHWSPKMCEVMATIGKTCDANGYY